MKKTLLSILTLALAANIQAADPTLLQEWTTDANMPARLNARSGAGFNGKFYVNEKGTGVHCFSYDQNTASVVKETVSGVSAGAMGPVFDNKGNAIFLNKWAGAGAFTELVIWNTNTNEYKTISITIPEGYTTARMDYIGRGAGNIFSETGGVVFMFSSGDTRILKIWIANGVQDVSKTKLIETNKTVDTATTVTPLTDDPESDIVAYRVRAIPGFVTNENGTWNAYTAVGNAAKSTGGDIVTLDNVVYTIEPAGTDWYDGFQVVRRDNNTIVATVDENLNNAIKNATSYGTCLSAEKVDEKTAYIYHYHPGSYITKYVLTTDQEVITGVEETMVDTNAPVEYYNLQGVKVENPSNGLFIKRQGAKATKVVL